MLQVNKIVCYFLLVKALKVRKITYAESITIKKVYYNILRKYGNPSVSVLFHFFFFCFTTQLVCDTCFSATFLLINFRSMSVGTEKMRFGCLVSKQQKL